jgi:hypothetical protein
LMDTVGCNSKSMLDINEAWPLVDFGLGWERSI